MINLVSRVLRPRFCAGAVLLFTFQFLTPSQAGTFTVTSTADSGSGTFRAGIEFANAHPGTRIEFDIPQRDAGFSRNSAPPISAGNPAFLKGAPGQIVFRSTDNNAEPRRDEIRAVNPDGSGERFVANAPPIAGGTGDRIAFSRDGKLAAFQSSSLFPPALAIKGKDNNLFVNIYVTRLGQPGYFIVTKNDFWSVYPALSPDGKLVAFGSRDPHHAERSFPLYIANADGTNLRRLTETGEHVAPAFSPDGQKIVFCASAPHDGLAVINTDGSGFQQLTTSRAALPTWSPDGKRIAFVSAREGNANIYIMDADGSNQKRLTDGGSNAEPCFSPDGKWIAFSSNMDTTGYVWNNRASEHSQIFVMRDDGSARLQLTSGKAINVNPTWLSAPLPVFDKAAARGSASTPVTGESPFLAKGAWWTIKPQSPLPPITADGTVIDGASQTRAQGDLNPEGPEIVLNGVNVEPTNGYARFLVFRSSHCVVQNIVVNGHHGSGVNFYGPDSHDNRIFGCYIGTSATGLLAAGSNYSGVLIGGGAHHNTVGGLTPQERNIISGTGWAGVELDGIGVHDNVIEGNYIGTDRNGLRALGNGIAGVLVRGGPCDNLIGGSEPGARNLISGNSDGIFIAATTHQGVWSPTTGNRVLGNWIGLDVSGRRALPNNGHGIEIIDSAANTQIGGPQDGARNVVSGNDGSGISLRASSETLVQGNYIGTDASGLVAVMNNGAGVEIYPNGYVSNTSSDGPGEHPFRARDNLIGGKVRGAGNVISGNQSSGVLLVGSVTTTRVQGNFIGLNRDGNAALPNGGSGVSIGGSAQHNLIGGENLGEGNVISGNAYNGVYISEDKSGDNRVQGNLIGTSAGGWHSIPNRAGVCLDWGAGNNLIGGSTRGARNIISGNRWFGVWFYGAPTVGNRVLGNWIGTDISGNAPLPNGFDLQPNEKSKLGNNTILEGGGAGVLVSASATRQIIGGVQKGEGNRIAFNNGEGVKVLAGSTGIAIRGNEIFSNTGLGIDLKIEGERDSVVTIAPAPNLASTPAKLENTKLKGKILAPPNARLIPPTLTRVLQTHTSVIISGALSASPNAAYELDFYQSSHADKIGFGQGEKYVRSLAVTTDSKGVAAFSVVLPHVSSTAFFNATATDTFRNTSEFSRALVAR